MISGGDEDAAVTRFNFQGRLFAQPGCEFRAFPGSGEPCFYAPLGGCVAGVPLSTFVREFRDTLSAADLELLASVASALRFVPTVRPGDAISSEIVDGTASWRYGPDHLEGALARSAAAVLAWAGAPPSGAEAGRREALADWDALGPTFRDALERLAAAAGLPVTTARSRLEAIAREFACIEALNEHYRGLSELPAAMLVWRGRLVRDCNRREEYDRMIALCGAALKEARGRIATLASVFARPDHSIASHGQTIAKIRQFRDMLHRDTGMWRRISPLWVDLTTEGEDEARQTTYRFLASRFPQTSEWGDDARR